MKTFLPTTRDFEDLPSKIKMINIFFIKDAGTFINRHSVGITNPIRIDDFFLRDVVRMPECRAGGF